uniref:Uncharacterized protein n=1 Tax=Oncorhynchus kisutch TaxID=8019 RepID=A0A8C7KSN2_ONCKI
MLFKSLTQVCQKALVSRVSPGSPASAGSSGFHGFWLAGAGAAVFMVLGATMFVIGSHAAFRELEGGSEMEELFIEPV